MKTSGKSILVVLAFCIASYNLKAIDYISLEDASKKGLVRLEIKSKGGHLGDVILMKIKNTCDKILHLKLEAGRRLDSKNNNEQDILVTKPFEMVVSPNQISEEEVFGMCCQAHNSGPSQGSVYYIGTMANDTNLIRIAEYIDKNKYYTNYAAQEAVWAISDNSSIGSISGGTKAENSSLQQFVSKLTLRKIPPYSVSYIRERPEDMQGRVNKVEGVFDYSVKENGHVTIAIYNFSGELVQLLFADISHKKGDYKLYYTFRVGDLPQGQYYARMYLNGNSEKEMPIEF